MDVLITCYKHLNNNSRVPILSHKWLHKHEVPGVSELPVVSEHEHEVSTCLGCSLGYLWCLRCVWSAGVVSRADVVKGVEFSIGPAVAMHRRL